MGSSSLAEMYWSGQDPRATPTGTPHCASESGELQTEADWNVQPTLVKKGASIGSGATILANVTIGENAIVGAGSTVTKDVPANTIVAGNPARILRALALENDEPFIEVLNADSTK